MIAQWVASHATPLNILCYALVAISLLFGSKALGRVRSLKQQGGVYSSFLVAVPSALFMGGIAYLLDLSTHLGPARLLDEAVGIQVNALLIAAAIGLIVGAIPALVAPAWTRRHPISGSVVTHSTKERHVLQLVGSLNAIFLAYVFAAAGCEGAVAVGRFPRPAVGPFAMLWALSSVIVLCLFFGFNWLLEVLGGARPYFDYVFPHRTVAWPKLIISVALCLVALGLYFPVTSYFNTLTHNIAAPFEDTLLALGAFLGSEFGLRAIRAATDRLDTRTLTTIFAVPGALAAIIGFFANFPALLGVLP